jgi:hypothetical protein
MAIQRRLTARNGVLALVIVLFFCFLLSPNPALLWNRRQHVEHYDIPGFRAEGAGDKPGSGVTAISSVNIGSGGEGKQGAAKRTAVVVASQASEDATWLDKYFPQWEKNVYRVDDLNAKLTVPKNKGRESMVYLT